ncbi:hypothetical protein MKW98_006586 [Papaver atlanticum]|uniref:Uncharacterized protein n=1 Tax=Papaver atlanticum TaxID=357466 RepID=A0AAD4T994_9MAGN|nr:hypothetical protein MKW98_006586 [Papaver atlanticum]
MGSLVNSNQSDRVDGFIAPYNFSVVESGVYRCSFPDSSNFSFIETLNLRSILCLCPDPYLEERTKEPSAVSKDMITEALEVLLDVRNHPILIHCKHGKHRTGCIEYQHFAGVKTRPTDMKFIENYDTSCLSQRFCSTIGYRQQYLVYQEESAGANNKDVNYCGDSNPSLLEWKKIPS